jgi:phage recombination protein Bet
MDNAVALREEITEAKIIEYLDAAGKTKDLYDNEKKMFLNIAREFGLNPFKREIHITAYGQGDFRQCSIITGYEVYIKRAERTGKLDGWEITTEGEGKNLKAIVKIYRKDMKYPFVHEVYYTECVQTKKNGEVNAIWAKQPRFMTKKVAIGQAFRLCFSDDLGGMPYEESEMPQEEPRNVTEQPVKEPEQKPHASTIPEKEMTKELEQLRRSAWEMIKKLPAEEQPKWIDQCKNATAETLKQIIQAVDAYLYKIQQAAEEKPTEDTTKERTELRNEILQLVKKLPNEQQKEYTNILEGTGMDTNKLRQIAHILKAQIEVNGNGNIDPQKLEIY